MRLDALLAEAALARAAPPFDTESGRAALAAIDPPFAGAGDEPSRRRALHEAIGRADTEDLRAALCRLRDAFDAGVLRATMSRVEAAFARSADDGWREWISTLARFVSEFRLGAAAACCGHAFPFTDPQKATVATLGLAIARMRQSRWEDAYTEIDLLASQACVTGLVRARLTMMLGQIQFHRLGDAAEARPLLEEAAKLAPSDGAIQSAPCELMLEEGRQDEAIACFVRATAAEPDASHGYIGCGDAAFRADAFEEAERWYRKAVEVAPGDALGHSRLQSLFGRSACIADQAAALEDALERRIALDPDDAYNAYLELGTSYQEARNESGAEAWFERAMMLQPEWPRAYLSLAELRRRQDRLDQAVDLCRRAIAVAPDWAESYIALSSVYAKAGRTREAASAYESIPEPVRRTGLFLRRANSFHNCLGDAYYFASDFESAEREYRLAIRESPGEATYHRNLALALQQRGDYAGARDAFQKAFEADQDHRALNDSLASLANAQGNAEYSEGRYREAIEHYRKAIGLRSSEAVFHSNLGGAWEQLALSGERELALTEAIASYEAADRVAGRTDRAGKIRRLRNRLEIARGWGSKALDRVCLVTPIAVEVASDLVPLVAGTAEEALTEQVKQLVDAMRSRVFEEMGVALPGIRFRGNEGDLSPGNYVIMLKEVPIVLGQVHRDRIFVTGAREELAALSSATAELDPLTGQPGFWLAQADVDRELAGSVQTWSPMEYVLRHIELVLRGNLAEFIGHDEVNTLVRQHAGHAEDLPGSSPVDLTGLTTVCRALLAEGVPIQPFDAIYECFRLETAAGVRLRALVEKIRGLEPFRARLPGNEVQRRVLAPGGNFEAALRGALYGSGSSTVLAMVPEFCQEILSAVRDTVDSRPSVLVVRDDSLRPFLRRLTEIEFPQLPVLSRAEFVADLESAAPSIIEIDATAGLPTSDFRSPRQADPALPEPEPPVSDTVPEIIVATSREFPDEATLGDGQPIEGLFALMQDGLFYELGIVVPNVRRDDDDPRLAPREFRLRIDAVDHGTRTGLEPGEFLVNETPERLGLLGITGDKAANPASGADNSRVRETGRELQACHGAGLTTWGPAGFIVLALSGELRKTAARFQTDSITELSLESLRAAYPVLVEQALARYPAATIAGVLRALLQEEIPVRDLRSILESLLALNGTTDADGSRYILFTAHTDNLHPSVAARDPARLGIAQLADFVRTMLKRQISHKYTRGRSTLVVLLLDPAIENRLGETGSRPLSQEEREQLLTAVETEWKDTRTSSPALLTTVEVRRLLRQLLRPRFPDLPVLAYQELSPELNIQPLARISLAE